MSDEGTNLDGVAETLLITLYVRALESERPDALIRDEKAVALVKGMGYDFSRMERITKDENDKTALILRNREFDRYAQDFLARNPQGAVTHIGCGLDSRFERVDDGSVEWFDLDLPDVIEVRKRLLVVGEEPRYHLLGCSVLDDAWMDTVGALDRRTHLFMAEGVFMYLEEAQVRSLVLGLAERFPGAELVFDTYRPYLVRMNNLRMRRSEFSARYHFGLKRPKDLEGWGAGVHFVGAWFPFDRPEPRLARIRWVRFIPPLGKALGIFHYRLGDAPKRVLHGPLLR